MGPTRKSTSPVLGAIVRKAMFSAGIVLCVVASTDPLIGGEKEGLANCNDVLAQPIA